MQILFQIVKGLGIFILLLVAFIAFFIASFLIGWGIIKLGAIKMGVLMFVVLIGGIYYALNIN
jgi:hypothetical protein